MEQKTYNLSRDYELLFDLINQGHRIACFLDKRNIGVCQLENIYSSIRAGSFIYSSRATREEFIHDCVSFNLEFIEPIIPVVSQRI